MGLFSRKPPPPPAAPVFSESAVETVRVDDTGAVVARETAAVGSFAERLDDDAAIVMRRVPAGFFVMGSILSEGFPDEKPQRQVSVPAFCLGRITVTQRQWNAVMRLPLPCRAKGPDMPLDRVNWFQAAEFCARLSKLTGRSYRLPSEAEWEYACRAGTTTPFSFGPTLTTDLADYVGRHRYAGEAAGVYRGGTVAGGSLPPNRFGLHEMHGNLFEWCADAWHDDYTGAPTRGEAWTGGGSSAHVLRGGSWHDPPNLCRSAARLKSDPNEGEDYFGFRVALSV
jgi:formylglycine-generating enzyme required for sulfatase activity